jgi:hypothetical protein
MMGYINFEDQVFIKRQWASKKKNVMDAGEKYIVEAEVHPFTKVHEMTKTQLRAMEIKIQESNVATKKRRAIMDKATLLEKGIHIPNLEQFMWIQMKQNYDRHVERMENWKDINEEED